MSLFVLSDFSMLPARIMQNYNTTNDLYPVDRGVF